MTILQGTLVLPGIGDYRAVGIWPARVAVITEGREYRVPTYLCSYCDTTVDGLAAEYILYVQ